MNVDSLAEITMIYFKYKKINIKQFFPYSWYKTQIKYICKIDDEKFIRVIFDKMIKKEYLNKIKNGKSTYYIFNPYREKITYRPDVKIQFINKKFRLNF